MVIASAAARAALDDISAMACSTLRLTGLLTCANCVSERADSDGESCVFRGVCLFALACDSSCFCRRETRTGRRPCVGKPFSAHSDGGSQRYISPLNAVAGLVDVFLRLTGGIVAISLNEKASSF